MVFSDNVKTVASSLEGRDARAFGPGAAATLCMTAAATSLLSLGGDKPATLGRHQCHESVRPDRRSFHAMLHGTAFSERVPFNKSGGTPPFHRASVELERQLHGCVFEETAEGAAFLFSPIYL